MRRAGPGDRAVALLVAVGAALLYASTAAPGTYWDDAGEVLAAAEEGGILHPPGHALPALVFWAVSRLGGGGESGARAVVALCGLVAAAACGLWALTALRWTGRSGPRSVTVGLVVCGAGAIATGTAAWRFGTTPEVYALVQLAVVLLVLALPSDGAPRGRGDLAAGYLVGISAAVHAMLVPLGGVVVAARWVSGRAVARMAVGGALGASVFLFLPLRGAVAPDAAWGEPWTLRGLADHLLARDFAAELATGAYNAAGQASTPTVVESFLSQGPVVLPLLGAALLVAPGGGMPLGRRLSLAGIALVGIGVAVTVGGGLVLDAYLLPAFVVLTLVAVVRMARWSRRGTVPRRVATLAVVALAIHQGASAVSRLPERDLSEFGATRAYAHGVVDAAPRGAVLLLDNTMDYFAVRELQAVAGMRRDLAPFYAPVLARPWGRRRFEQAVAPLPRDAEPDLTAIARAAAASGRPVLYGPLQEFRLDPRRLRPAGALYQWGAAGVAPAGADDALDRFIELAATSADPWTPRRAVLVLVRRSEQAVAAGHSEAGVESLRRAVALRPDDAGLHFNLGTLLRWAGRPEEALGPLERAATLAEYDPRYVEAVGGALAESGRSSEAARALRRSLALGADGFSLRYNLGTSLLRAGRPGEAVVELRKALRFDDTAVEAWNNLALGLAATGRRDEAVTAVKEGLARAPRHAGLLENLRALESDGPG